MNGFTADWLSLREPADHAARAGCPLPPFEQAPVPTRRARTGPGGALTVLDLACGTGANLRHLAPRLGGRQQWTLLDHDAALLAQVGPALARWASAHRWVFVTTGDRMSIDGDRFVVDVHCLQRDLVRDDIGDAIAHSDLVTASALLDLVSAGWLATLIDRCILHRTMLHCALSFDGRIAWQPADRFDAAIVDALNAHQRRDKGFGVALGPQAAAFACQRLSAAGRAVHCVPSDWIIDGSQAALQQRLIDDWSTAAAEVGTLPAQQVAAWRQRRLRLQSQAGGTLVVGHQDLWAP